VRDGRVRIYPGQLAARYFDWVDDMHDWCISRQLWWGHRIPVWYGPDDQVRCVGPGEEAPGEGWTQDTDVLDTWFSSALWPFSTLGWPDDTADLRTFYPTSVLVTGYDILFFWVARMMLFGLYANAEAGPEGSVPFRQVSLHGLVRDQFGKKMSKSRGNTVDPLDWITRFGADATRFTLARGASPGGDVALSEEWVLGSRNFCNKLWNAVRFALLNGALASPQGRLDEKDLGELSVPDRWILSRLGAVTAQADALFDEFEFAKVSDLLYHFAWDEVCDWYLELAKPALNGDDEVRADRTRRVLGHVLDQLLRLVHPLMPFVTEELWTALTGGESVMVAAWPSGLVTGGEPAVSPAAAADPVAESEIESLMRLVTAVRRFRADQGLRPSQPVPARFAGIEGTRLAPHERSIRSLLRLTEPDGGSFRPNASVEAESILVELDTSSGIDVVAERRRLEKDLAIAVADVEVSERKLSNSSFIDRAPAEVVAKSRDRLASARSEIARLEERLAALADANA
jgi:valyl-tRNA synthetase